MAKRSFTLELLREVIKRDGATLVGEYAKLNRESRIKFLCSCGEEYEKGFRVIFEHQACCKKCTLNNLQEKATKTSLEKYGTKHPQQNKEIRSKYEKTCIEKYGETSHNKSKSIKEKKANVCFEKFGCKTNLQTTESKDKIKQTNLQRYGVEHVSQSKEVQEKTIQTNMQRFGVKAPSQNKDIYAKMLKTTKERFGVENASKCKEVQEKIKQTNLQRYGVERPAQSEEFQAQNQHKAYKRKEFVMPSGDIRSVQGSEPFALRDLLGAGYVEDHIKTTRQDIPRIQYDCNGKQRYYFPDIFLPHENKLIEVKSTWTYKTDWDKKLKYQKDAVEKQGYAYEIWIYNAKGVRVQSGNLLAR